MIAVLPYFQVRMLWIYASALIQFTCVLSQLFKMGVDNQGHHLVVIIEFKVVKTTFVYKSPISFISLQLESANS